MVNKDKVVSDLTGYASLLGESFSSKIDLLSQIIKHGHYPSVGRYKERLLSKTIAEYIPKRFEVGTGFVLFPAEPEPGSLNNPDFDPINMGAHVLSKQCDVIVYDSSAFPVVFRDDDFVVVRPESVKSVIEVKGTINPNEVESALCNFLDFGKKWTNCQLFYKARHQEVVRRPSLFALGWEIYKKSGKNITNGMKIRQQVTKFYKTYLKEITQAGFPILDKLLIYNDCEVFRCGWSGKVRDTYVSKEGFMSTDGRFTRFDSNGNAYRGGDRTIASLLASIHYSLGDGFNRFFSYTDETRAPGKYIPYKYEGHDFFVENDIEVLKILNTDVP